MLRLSGDHATSLSDPLVNVICRGSALPSFGTIHRSDDCSFSSYEGLVTEKTVHLPSGLGAGPPTRFISHIASCVRARFAGILTTSCAASAPATNRRAAANRKVNRSMAGAYRTLVGRTSVRPAGLKSARSSQLSGAGPDS